MKEFLEQEIAKKAKSVFDFAYIQALENDLKVTKIDNDSLYEYDSNGNKIFIKKVKKYKIENKNVNKRLRVFAGPISMAL